LVQVTFAQAIRYGLGRAILHVRQHDPKPYRQLILDQLILDACLYDDVFESQMNHDRGQYLFDLIPATGEQERYRRRLLRALDQQAPAFAAVIGVTARAAGRVTTTTTTGGEDDSLELEALSEPQASLCHAAAAKKFEH
jgi:hypothetical protein